MRYLAAILALAAAVGCSTTGLRDARLIGTWRSNGERTVAKMFQRDPRWTNAPPERVQKVKDMFGQMTVTYSGGTIGTDYRGERERLGYKVVERGQDYVVLRIRGGLEDRQNIRIRFVDDAQAYWIQSFVAPSIEERFDKVITEPGGAANGSQPIRSETNRTSSAAGSRR
jgi:hypothetical protein